MTTPGSTVPMIKPLLVIPETVDVPLSVTHVANQYIMIEKSPTKTPFCARSGTPIMYAMDAAAKSQYGGVPHHVLNPLEEDGRKAQMQG